MHHVVVASKHRLQKHGRRQNKGRWTGKDWYFLVCPCFPISQLSDECTYECLRRTCIELYIFLSITPECAYDFYAISAHFWAQPIYFYRSHSLSALPVHFEPFYNISDPIGLFCSTNRPFSDAISQLTTYIRSTRTVCTNVRTRVLSSFSFGGFFHIICVIVHVFFEPKYAHIIYIFIILLLVVYISVLKDWCLLHGPL